MNIFTSQCYPDIPKPPAWGAPESQANFCEEDYIITSYIAEFVNTLTNLTYIIYAIHGLRRLRGNSGGPFSFLGFPYWGLAAVGICSGYFHGTLKYHSQMSDELSMLVATGLVLHRVLTFDGTPAYRRNGAVILLGILIPISVYHCVADETLVHVMTFGVMIVAIGVKTRQLVRLRIKDSDVRMKVRKLERFGACCAGLGFFLWNIDLHFCPTLTKLKRRIGLPFGMLLELHGWWHVLTAICAYIFMALTEYLTSDNLALGDRIEEGFVWPVRAVLRDVKGNENQKKKER
ncbi:alkaline ceramidase family protein [Lepidopterella palustris CBS 459.81]|uniref:Alkaline ceramidase family protein n=1 Tax=Lepidopterella palustris CBS 459.81 TaxID=1314670 RepID=A0A8E2EFW7_9PEZI|nr:alkaline ceramidase family protein [Lepidopterella palustris CBS 459.81]